MIKVGCCGYPVSMKKYYEKFSLVELNTTFYNYPRTSTVEGWRKKAPEDFEFTVKAHQDISHKFKLKPEKECIEAFEKMKEICKILKAEILLIQTPASLRPDKLEEVEGFFRKVNRENLRLVWETRGPAWETLEIREKLREKLRELDVSHVTDPFKMLPVYTGEVAYFRLHGLGEKLYYYQYSDEELRRLYETLKKYEEKAEVYVLFNNLSMFDDALRFVHYIKNGSFPSLTGTVGLESVRHVLSKTRYPTTKSLLLKRVGWRLVEIEEGKQVRLETLLKEIPSKTYNNVDELMKEIKV